MAKITLKTHTRLDPHTEALSRLADTRAAMEPTVELAALAMSAQE